MIIPHFNSVFLWQQVPHRCDSAVLRVGGFFFLGKVSSRQGFDADGNAGLRNDHLVELGDGPILLEIIYIHIFIFIFIYLSLPWVHLADKGL